MTAFANDQQTPAISSTCQIRSSPGGKDGSTVEYSWKTTAKTSEDRVLSVYQLTRTHPAGEPAMIRGWQKFLYCKAGTTHEKETKLKVDQALDGGERAYWFEGFLTGLINEDISLPKSAAVSVTTRQITGGDNPGHLIDITVSNDDREISRHFIFVSFWSPADLQEFLSGLTEKERELRDGNVWQDIITDAVLLKSSLRRFEASDK